MNQQIATYCEIPNLPKKMAKKQKLPKWGRTYLPGFQRAVMEAKTVGDIVKAYKKFASDHGVHSDMGLESWEKIEKACKCKEPV